jgi:hypothetical protein
MAKKPVELCLELKGEDAVQFYKYLDDPDDITPEGRELLKEAKLIARQRRLSKK